MLTSVRVLAVVVAVAASGCWHDVEPPRAPIAPAERAQPRVVETRPHVVRSVWVGHYVCTQGLTGLVLTIEARGESVTAIFDFGPLDSNPSVPRGSYRMTGTMRDDGTELFVDLAPDEWIDQPTNYGMVGLYARTIERSRLRGRIRYAGCGALEAELQP
jgi:hypothetical protein